MNFSDYCSELMKQSFNDSTGYNYTPLAIMFYLRENNYYFEEKTFDDLIKYVYRFYVDNKHFARSNSNVVISNIHHYCALDIREYMFEQMKIWMQNGSGVLLFDGNKILINKELPILTAGNISMLNKVIDSLILRNFRCSIQYNSSIQDEMKTVECYSHDYYKYTNSLNKTRFVNRAYEDLDYCVCCDETNRSLLQPIHINRGVNQSESGNSLIFCKEHAQLYFEEYFRFDRTGKIIILKNHPLLDKRMHLSQKILKIKLPYLTDEEV